MNIRPLHDRLFIERIDEGEQHIGGIIIPDTAREKPQRGSVIAAGSGKAKAGGGRIPLDVQAGDLVLFGKYSGQEIKVGGREYLILKEEEVLAIVTSAGRAPAAAPERAAVKAAAAAPARSKAAAGAKRKVARAKPAPARRPAAKGRKVKKAAKRR